MMRRLIQLTASNNRARTQRICSYFIFALFAFAKFGFLSASALDAAKPLLDRARQARMLQENQKALELYSKAVVTYPKNVTALIERSDVYKELGQMDNAISDAEKAARLAPKNLDLISVRAHLYDMSGKLDKAICDYTTIINAGKNESGPYRGRAIAYKRLKKYASAASDFGSAAQVEPSARDYNANLYDQGDMLVLAGDPNSAIKVFTTLIKVAPDFSTGYWGRARAFDKLGKSALAERDRAAAKKRDENF